MNTFDIIVKDARILTMNPENPEIQGGFIAVRSGKIVALGSGDELPEAESGEIIDGKNCVVMPGLVNVHTHLPMSLFRGLADDLPLMTWLNEHIFPAEAEFVGPESVRIGALLACAEMIMSGTTCCCDGYFHEAVVADALIESGMRGVLAQGVIDFPAPGVPDPRKNVDHAVDYVKAFAGRSPMITPSIFCHSPYTCSRETLKNAKAAADSHGVLFQVHASETEAENRQILAEQGCTPIQYLDRLGILDERTLIAHAVWVDEEDMEIIARSGARVSHNPESNMKLASGVAPVPDLLSAGIIVGLGTDGCASNNDLDLFSEMDTAAKLHKVHRLDPTVMDAETVLRMATVDGARALGLSDRIGTLETGKEADLIVIDLAKPHLAPLYRPVSHMVYAARGSDVRDVIAGGKILMRDRVLTTLDLSKILEDAAAMGRSISRKG